MHPFKVLLTFRPAGAAAVVLCALSLLASVSAARAADSQCAIEINSTDAMAFDRKEMVVLRSCDKVQVTLHHTGKLPIQVMGHNWVVVKEADAAAFLKSAVTVGPQLDYVPANDPRVVAHTKLIGGGETTTTTLDVAQLDPAQSYIFICSFPGHGTVMRGTLILK